MIQVKAYLILDAIPNDLISILFAPYTEYNIMLMYSLCSALMRSVECVSVVLLFLNL